MSTDEFLKDIEVRDAPCKYAVRGGGDWVPYGEHGAHLPTYTECDHPDLDEDWQDDCDTCPHYEPDPNYVPEPPCCPHCGGDGYKVVGKDEEGDVIWEKCPMCKGSGIERCPDCGGNGFVSTRIENGGIIDECPRCKGSGEWRGKQ